MSYYVVQRLNAADIKFIVDEIVKEIRRRAARYGVSEKDVEAALAGCDAIVEDLDLSSDLDGTFAPGQEGNGMNDTVYLNHEGECRSTKMKQVIAHEVARFLMRDWVPSALFGADAVTCPRRDNANVRYQIARYVHQRF